MLDDSNSGTVVDPSTGSCCPAGIVPYINASIILQLLSSVFPSLKKLQREEGTVVRNADLHISPHFCCWQLPEEPSLKWQECNSILYASAW